MKRKSQVPWNEQAGGDGTLLARMGLRSFGSWCWLRLQEAGRSGWAAGAPITRNIHVGPLSSSELKLIYSHSPQIPVEAESRGVISRLKRLVHALQCSSWWHSSQCTRAGNMEKDGRLRYKSSRCPHIGSLQTILGNWAETHHSFTTYNNCWGTFWGPESSTVEDLSLVNFNSPNDLLLMSLWKDVMRW